MTSADLTDNQIERLFTAVERQRRFAERLVARCVARGFPPDDALFDAARQSARAIRGLALQVNDLRPKGVAHAYLRRTRGWPAV